MLENRPQNVPVEYHKLLSDIPVIHDLFPYAITSVLLDTNILLGDIRYMARNSGKETILLKLAQTGRIKLLFPEQGLVELENHFPKIAKEINVKISDVKKLWDNRFAPLVQVIPYLNNVGSYLEDQLQQRDPQDLQFLRAALDLNPDWFLTEDKDLLSLGLGTAKDVRLLFDLQEYHAGRSISCVIEYGGYCVSIVGFLAITAFFETLRAMTRILMESPIWIKYLVFFLLIVTIFLPNTRKWIKHTFNNVTQELGSKKEVISQLLLSLSDTLQNARKLEKISSARLKDRSGSYNVPQMKEAKQYIIRVLSQSPTPLTAKQVAQRVIELGYLTTNTRFDQYVRKILRSNAIFSENSSGKWIIGFKLKLSEQVPIQL